MPPQLSMKRALTSTTQIYANVIKQKVKEDWRFLKSIIDKKYKLKNVKRFFWPYNFLEKCLIVF